MACSSWATAVIAWEMFLSVCGLGFLLSGFVAGFFDDVVVGGAEPRFFTWEYLGAMSTSRNERWRARWDVAGHVQCVENGWDTSTQVLGGKVGPAPTPLGTGAAQAECRSHTSLLRSNGWLSVRYTISIPKRCANSWSSRCPRPDRAVGASAPFNWTRALAA